MTEYDCMIGKVFDVDITVSACTNCYICDLRIIHVGSGLVFWIPSKIIDDLTFVGSYRFAHITVTNPAWLLCIFTDVLKTTREVLLYATSFIFYDFHVGGWYYLKRESIQATTRATTVDTAFTTGFLAAMTTVLCADVTCADIEAHT